MSLFVRKIERAKWMRRSSDAIEDTPADAITSCLRTSSNTLSVWRIEGEDQLARAIVAIVAAGEKLETMDFVVLREEDLDAQGLKVRPSPGGTRVKDMVDAHCDLVDLTYATLGRVAGIVLAIIRDNEVKRWMKSELTELMRGAIASNRLAADDLGDRLREKLFGPRR